MPTTLTLKNIPDVVYQRLKSSAKANRRSLNGEAIVCLENVLQPRDFHPEAFLQKVREMRSRMTKVWVTEEDLDAAKWESRL